LRHIVKFPLLEIKKIKRDIKNITEV
jgi:hypothetical protein